MTEPGNAEPVWRLAGRFERQHPDILKRIQAIEARQRDYGMHDPDCPQLLQMRAQAETLMLLNVPECTCWLSEEEAP